MDWHWHETASDLKDSMHKGDLDYCIEHVSQLMARLPQTPFHLILKSHFTNDPHHIAHHFDTFFGEMREFVPAAIYTETNGFFINPDRWYFELFGYKVYGGHNGYDWLSQWDILYQESLTLTGMEALQQVYADDMATQDYDPVRSQARNFSDLLIVYKFQTLIQQSVPLMQTVQCPILATSHEYDLIFEATPSRADE